jgi:hypothetical protein
MEGMRPIIFVFLLFSSVVIAQKTERLEQYTASNGITYKIGDEIKLTRGSNPNGKFVYVTVGGWATSMNSEANQLGALNTGLIVHIKKIRKYNKKHFKGVYFTVGGGNITNYLLDIEGALASCEIENCNEKKPNVLQVDKYDQLAKLKELYDEGVLTEQEYETEKKKILDQN